MSGNKSVLFVAANPVDQAPTQFEEEYDCICKELDFRIDSNAYRLRSSILSVNMQKLQQEMNRRLPYILHFAGHGNSKEGLYFVDAGQISDLVSAEQFGKSIAVLDNEKLICCVVLNTCWSEEVARVLTALVPYVIGSEKELRNTAAIAFSSGFYMALASGRDIDNAFEQGQLAIENQGINNSDVLKILKNKELIQRFKQREEMMAKKDKSSKNQRAGINISNNRSINIGGNASGSVIISGDGNTVSQNPHNNTAPPTEGSTEEAKLCLAEISNIIDQMQLSQANTIKTNKALETASEFIELENPLRKEFAEEIAAALELIREEEAFASYKAELRSPIEKLKTWLGENWMHLSTLAGILK